MPGISDNQTPEARFPLLSSVVLNTNELLRQRALRLVAHGISQKVLAAKMGMQASTFSRWLNQKDSIGPISVTALDGFNAYLGELADLVTDKGVSIDQIRQSTAPAPRGHVKRLVPSEAAEKKGRRTKRQT